MKSISNIKRLTIFRFQADHTNQIDVQIKMELAHIVKIGIDPHDNWLNNAYVSYYEVLEKQKKPVEPRHFLLVCDFPGGINSWSLIFDVWLEPIPNSRPIIISINLFLIKEQNIEGSFIPLLEGEGKVFGQVLFYKKITDRYPDFRGATVSADDGSIKADFINYYSRMENYYYDKSGGK